MQIVIDISKDTFEKIREFDGKHDVLIDRGKLYEAIQNGIPLLKGHGRLIDADAYKKEMLDSREFDFFKRLDMQLTIIEAEAENQ